MIYEKYYNAESKRKTLKDEDYHDDRIGFWGIVESVDSLNNCCTVKSDIGRTYKGIPVFSAEWVCGNQDKNYISASRNLPPIGSIVFVLMPTRTISGAFILCSGYTRGNENLKTLFSDNFNKDIDDTRKQKKTCGGWTLIEDYESGNISIESDSKNIRVELNENDNFERNEGQRILIKGFNTEISITENGINITSNETNTTIEGDSSIFVSGDSSICVEGDSNVFVKGNGNSEIEGNAVINVKGNTSLTTSKFTVNDTSLEVV